MARLQLATPEQVREIYGESHAVWGAGLSQTDYLELWQEICRTPWAGKWVRFHVWTDAAGRLLSSLKLYRPLVRWSDGSSRVGVLGAIFTPRAERGRGHAADMVRAVLQQARDRGDRSALLFSDIGTRYYSEGFGFSPLPADEQWGSLPRRMGAPGAGWRLRPMLEEDVPAIREAHERTSRLRTIAVVRDAEHWNFLRVRSGAYFERYRDPGIRQVCRVALRDGSVAGFVISVEGRGEWNVREIGASDGSPSTLATILRLGGAEARRLGLRRVYGWLPPEVLPHLGDWKLSNHQRKQAVPMILALDETVDVARLDDPGAAYIPYQDQF